MPVWRSRTNCLNWLPRYSSKSRGLVFPRSLEVIASCTGQLNFKTKKNLDSGELDRIDSLDGWWPPENWVQEET
jgi:hypothetical protein